MTPQDIIDQLSTVTIEQGDKFVIDTKIPMGTSAAEAEKIVKQQVDTLIKRGVNPEYIGIIGLPKEFADLNASIEKVVGSLGSSFGGAVDLSSFNLDGYLKDIDDIIDNKIVMATSIDAKLPENIPVDKSLVTKFARSIGEDLFSFPDTFQAEERPVDGKTPLSDWKDRTNVTTTTAGGTEWSEKKSQFSAEYGKNIIYKSNSGHFIEMDDTEGSERINIQHKNGTFITIMPDKTIVIRAQNGAQIITYGNAEMFVGGKINITCIGDVNISSNGNTNIDTLGDVNWKVGGNFNLDVKGETSIFNQGVMKLTARQIRQNAGDPRKLEDVKEKEYKLGS